MNSWRLKLKRVNESVNSTVRKCYYISYYNIIRNNNKWIIIEDIINYNGHRYYNIILCYSKCKFQGFSCNRSVKYDGIVYISHIPLLTITRSGVHGRTNLTFPFCWSRTLARLTFLYTTVFIHARPSVSFGVWECKNQHNFLIRSFTTS